MIDIENVWEKEWFHRIITERELLPSVVGDRWFKFHIKPEIAVWLEEKNINIHYRKESYGKYVETGLITNKSILLEYRENLINIHLSFESQDDLNLLILTW